MVCNFSLRSVALQGSAPNGTWSQLGFNPSSANGVFGAGGTVLALGGDNPTIDPSMVIQGFYQLAYDDGCNPLQIVVIQISAAANTGVSTPLTYCISDNQTINLISGLSFPAPNGIWSVSPSSNPQPPTSSYNLQNGTFNLANLTQAGSYKFNYSIQNQPAAGFLGLPCTNCSSIGEVTINVTPAFVAGNSNSIVVSQTQGAFNLFNYLGGTPDTSGVWAQITGSAATLINGYLGAINLDANVGCNFSFKYSGGVGNCYNESVVTVQKDANFNLNITNSSGTLTANHNACSGATYQWQINTGAGFVNVAGATAQTLAVTQSATYKVILNCNGCIQSNTIVFTQNCTNNPCFSFAFNPTTDCLTLQPIGSNTAPIATDTTEWKLDGGTYAAYTAPLCGCTINEFLNVTPFCSVFSGNLRVGYSSFTSCPARNITQIIVEYGNGTTEIHVGSLPSDYVQWTPAQWVARGNTAIFRIKMSTPAGDLFKFLKFTYSGSGTTCSSFTTEHLNYPKIYYKVWGRRTTTYANGCAPTSCETFYQPNNGCILDVFLTKCNISSTNYTGAAACANVSNCTTTPTYSWKYNGTLLSGQTEFFCPTTFGNGIYECTVVCGACTAVDTIIVQPACTTTVAITLNGSNLVATVGNCGVTPTYQWQFYNSASFVNVGGNANTYAPTQNGTYKVIVTCGTCVVETQITYTTPCTVTATITQIGNVLSANQTGCVGAVTYLWHQFVSGAWVTLAATQSITVAQVGLYRVTVTCGGCTAQAQYNYSLPCNVSVTISATGVTNPTLTANQTGCIGAVVYLWERYNGSNWVVFGSTQSIVANIINSFYRVTVTCGGCTAQATYNYSGCAVTATITATGSTLTANQTGCVGAATYLWELSVNSGTTWSNFATTQSINVAQNGIYRVTVTCGGCTAQAQTAFTQPCTTNVSLNYNSSTAVFTANISGCASPTIIWQYSNGYNPATGGCTGWVQVASGVTSIVAQNTGCYRVIVFCGGLGVCPTEATQYVVINNSCDSTSMIVSPTIGKIGFGVLKKNGVTVTNYLISWRNVATNTEVFRSGAGSFFNAATMYAHPSNNIPLAAGTYKAFILNSDFGNNLDCFQNYIIPAIQCADNFQLAYSGAGGIAATQSVSVAVSGPTGHLKMFFKTYAVADKLQVKYNGAIVFDSGNVTTSFGSIFVVPIIYVSGQNLAEVIVTNSTPSQSTDWELSIRCCAIKTACPLPLSLLQIGAAVSNGVCGCQFLYSPSFGGIQGLFENYCLSVTSISPNFAITVGGCSQSLLSANYACADCANIQVLKISGQAGMTIDFPATCNARYLSFKARLQAITNARHYVEFNLKAVTCASDGLSGLFFIFPLHGTIAFDDTNRRITYTMPATNPFSTSCTNCDALLSQIFDTGKNLINDAASYYYTNAWKSINYDRTLTAQSVVVSPQFFSEKMISECGTQERKYKISFRDAACPCQSWELYEDVSLNGQYTTLRQQATGWTGVCS